MIHNCQHKTGSSELYQLKWATMNDLLCYLSYLGVEKLGFFSIQFACVKFVTLNWIKCDYNLPDL